MVDREFLEILVLAGFFIILNYFLAFYVFVPSLDVLIHLGEIVYEAFGIYTLSFSKPLPPSIKTVLRYAFWIFSSIVTFVSLFSRVCCDEEVSQDG